MGFLYFSDTSFTKNIKTKSNLAKYAEEVLMKCSAVKYRPGCYDKEIPKLMDYISMEEAFDITRLVQKEDPQYLYCHVLGHNLSKRETDKDPSKWMDVITRCPATMCNNGCLHGSMMARYKSESLNDEQIEKLKPDIQRICEPRGKWKPTPIEISMCYHAIGHLAMYITDADLNKSADLCTIVGTKEDGRNYVQTCTEGVFMEVFQSLDPEDVALVAKIKPTKDKVDQFCGAFKNDFIKFEACHRESWTLFQDELKDAKSLEKFCSFSDRPLSYKTCQAAMMNHFTVEFVIDGNDMNKLDNFCMGLDIETHKRDCYAYAAGRLVQIDPEYTDKGLLVCNLAKKRGLERECYTVLSEYGKRTFHVDTKEFKEYCAKMPDTWNDYCLNNTNIQ